MLPTRIPSNSLLGKMREPMYSYSELFPFEIDDVEFKDNEAKIDVPGFNYDNLEVFFDKGYLTVRGQTDTRKLNKTVYVGNNADTSKVFVKDGVLTVKLDTQKQSTRYIPIEEG